MKSRNKEELLKQVVDELTEKYEAASTFDGLTELTEEEQALLRAALESCAFEENDAETIPTKTPFFEAVCRGEIDAVVQLHRKGADVNETDAEGNTALILAVHAGQKELVDALIGLGANPDQTNEDGVTPLFVATFDGNEDMVKVLAKGGASLDGRSKLNHNGTLVAGCTALYGAAGIGSLKMCRLLLRLGADLDAMNDLCATPLTVAIHGGHADITEFLLEKGAVVDFDLAPPDHVLSDNQLLELGGLSPLYVAVRKRNVPLIRKLLKRGADVNRAGWNSMTPLKSAAYHGYLDVVKVLLKAGADPNIADNTNYTPLMNAVAQEHENIVKLLLENGADPNIQSNWGDRKVFGLLGVSGQSALMIAASEGYRAIARILLAHGANPNLMDEHGETALDAAIKLGEAKLISLLLGAGANADP